MRDLTTDFDKRVARQLQEESIIWLTTVRADMRPQPSPVWFLWNGQTFLLYSRPDTPKVRNIAHNPWVALNLNSDKEGNQVVIFSGKAEIDPNPSPPNEVTAYIEKYRQGITDIQMTPESFAQVFSVAIRVTPLKIQGH